MMTSEPRSLKSERKEALRVFSAPIPSAVVDYCFDRVEALLRRTYADIRLGEPASYRTHLIRKNKSDMSGTYCLGLPECPFCLLEDLLDAKEEEKIVIKDRRIGECSFCGSTIYESEGFCIMCNTDKNVLLDKDVEATKEDGEKK